MKKFLSFAVCALLTVFVTLSLSACGDDDSEVVKIPDSGMDNGHAYVDLGLPSGLKWATCNVGADKPEDYGNYFAWGEISVKSIYEWNTYKWGTDTTQFTKYCSKSIFGKNGFTDDKTTLDSEDDAAHANWGGQWRMPTIANFNELINNTTVKWVENYNDTGVSGFRFTASNGNYIFLPAAGYRRNTLYNAGSAGYYWSSLLDTDYPYLAYIMVFNSGKVGVNSGYRIAGFSIRPVRP